MEEASFTFSDLGDGQYHVFEQLPFSSVYSALQVSQEWNKWISSLWKQYVLRDFYQYTITKPATVEDLEKMETELERNERREEPVYPDNPFAHFERFAPSLVEDFWTTIRSPNPVLAQVSDPWKQLYQDCSQSFNLTGTWNSIYGGHGEEFIQVEHNGYQILGTKLKGDINVPATKRTFEMTILKNSFGRIGIGRIHLADTGYRNPRWGFATIKIIDPHRFELYWYLADDYYVANIYTWSERQDIPMGRPETEVFALFGMP